MRKLTPLTYTRLGSHNHSFSVFGHCGLGSANLLSSKFVLYASNLSKGNLMATTTFNSGSLGLHYDEEHSYMCQIGMNRKIRLSSSLTHKAVSTSVVDCVRFRVVNRVSNLRCFIASVLSA